MYLSSCWACHGCRPKFLALEVGVTFTSSGFLGPPDRLSFRSRTLGLIKLRKAKTMILKRPTINDNKSFGCCGDLDVLIVWVESIKALHCFFIPVAVSTATVEIHVENSFRQLTL